MKKRGSSLHRSDNTQLKKRETSKLILIFLIGVGILLVALFLFFMAFFKRSWSDTSDRNILLVPETVDGYTGKILFAHISPSNKKIQIVMLNPELQVNVIGGYSQYPLRSIYPLWQLEKRDNAILPAIYSFALSKVVDQVWQSTKYNFDAEHPDFKQITQNLLFFKIASPLTLSDRIWLYKFTHSLRPDEIEVTQINTIADWQKMQSDITFSDQSSSCNFAIINTISVSGAGTRVGNMLEDSGFSIVRITDEDPEQAVTQLVLGDNSSECQDQQDHALHAMPLNVKVIHDAGRASQYRANMVLVLGTDMKQYFGAKAN